MREQRRVCQGILKTNVKQMLFERQIPGARSLLQAVNGFLEATYISWTITIHKTRRFGHVHFFSKFSLKKRVIHIELLDLPSSVNYNIENQTYGRGFNYGTERLTIIYTVLLSVAPNDKTSLWSLFFSIREVFHGVYPATTH